MRITLNAKGSNRVGPQTVIDAPMTGAVVGSPFFVGGWAADLDSTIDTGVNTVHVWAYRSTRPARRRSDLHRPGHLRRRPVGRRGRLRRSLRNSGYGIIVNGLAPGTYDLAVFAYSTVVNNFTAAKVVRVTVH
jgi:hypothetical protein